MREFERARYCDHAASMVWKKQLPGGKVGVLLMNNRNVTADVNVSWAADLPHDIEFRCAAGGCPVRERKPANLKRAQPNRFLN